MVLISDILIDAVKQYTANLESGVQYCIKNDKGQTVVDLSGGDGKSSWTEHKGPNQRWTVEKHGLGWYIKSVGSGKYLNVEGEVRDGTRVIACDEPMPWRVWADDRLKGIRCVLGVLCPGGLRLIGGVDGGYRIVLPDTNQNLDLSDHGNSTPGTAITLWSQSDGRNQLWKFEKG
ncbi:hypothetical protein CVT26_007235 [Gymnopilus dilepis]|uniref:Ricin B lectin domain-containing protein n=1 Tax=Gymnopilus dilepis TaxID=231916 RepID=A0A409VMF5_9AGAR|nr:hypothetical protein CVT26_007235 [Gymnopilus dilepis]